MNTSSPLRLRRGFSALVILAWLGVGATIGCDGGLPVTPEAIDQAKRLWSSAGIRDYELDWSTTGPNNAHYLVTVQAGEVRKVDAIEPDGRHIELHPGSPRFFGVDGLFVTISDELAQLKTDKPFGQPAGTKVVMRFRPDAKLGYPQWYRRDILGTSQAVTIDVNKLASSARATTPKP
jgi:hypothetical protein